MVDQVSNENRIIRKDLYIMCLCMYDTEVNTYSNNTPSWDMYTNILFGIIYYIIRVCVYLRVCVCVVIDGYWICDIRETSSSIRSVRFNRTSLYQHVHETRCKIDNCNSISIKHNIPKRHNQGSKNVTVFNTIRLKKMS